MTKIRVRPISKPGGEKGIIICLELSTGEDLILKNQLQGRKKESGRGYRNLRPCLHPEEDEEIDLPIFKLDITRYILPPNIVNNVNIKNMNNTKSCFQHRVLQERKRNDLMMQ